MAALGQAADPAVAGTREGVPPPPGTGGAPAPSLQDPVSGPASLLGGFLRNYGPTIVASGASLFQRAAAQTPGAAGPLLNLAAASAASSAQRPPQQQQSAADRQRQLESELAGLEDDEFSESNPPSFPVPIPHKPGTTGYSALPQSASEADLRARVNQFEEVEVPSDVEGYDAGGPRRGGPTTAEGKRTSWFGR